MTVPNNSFSLGSINDVEDGFLRVKGWIEQHLSFDPKQYNDAYLKRRIQSRMFFLQIDDYVGYLHVLEESEEERTKLLKNLTVNVTRFFRNKPLFTELKGHVLPELLKRKGNGEIRIWSAGCSSGEEPYSIAIMLAEYYGSVESRPNITIYATDIDKDALNKGMIGEYTESQLMETPQEIIDKYFIREDGVYVVNEEIRKWVSFRKHDLFRDQMLEKMDLILCRNVVIYFNTSAKERLYVKFYNSLNPLGYYILGRSETLTGDARQLFSFVNSDEKVFQKP